MANFLKAIFGQKELSEKDKFETLRDDGVRAMQMNELPYAEKCLIAALGLQHDLRALSFLAEVYLRQQKWEDALPLLKEIVASPDASLETKLLLAQTQGELSLFQDERETTSAILESSPEEPRALYLAAEADNGLKDYLPAIAHLTQCLTLRPDFVQAQLLRARVLCAMEQYSEALADADTLCTAFPEEEDVYLLRARIYLALEQTAQATNDLQHIRQLNPFSEQATLLLGKIYEQTSAWDKALALYDETLELMPRFAACYLARGRVKRHLKDDAGAAEDMKCALELSPESAKQVDGEFTAIENEMNARYRALNPYGF